VRWTPLHSTASVDLRKISVILGDVPIPVVPGSQAGLVYIITMSTLVDLPNMCPLVNNWG